MIKNNLYINFGVFICFACPESSRLTVSNQITSHHCTVQFGNYTIDSFSLLQVEFSGVSLTIFVEKRRIIFQIIEMEFLYRLENTSFAKNYMIMARVFGKCFHFRVVEKTFPFEQCVASFFYLYFACLTPIVTFGGLLSDATGKNMGAIESLLAGMNK